MGLFDLFGKRDPQRDDDGMDELEELLILDALGMFDDDDEDD